MKIIINNTDIEKILKEKYGEDTQFEIHLTEDTKLLEEMWNEKIVSPHVERKSRYMSCGELKILVNCVDKRIRPSRYGGSSNIDNDIRDIKQENSKEFTSFLAGGMSKN